MESGGVGAILAGFAAGRGIEEVLNGQGSPFGPAVRGVCDAVTKPERIVEAVAVLVHADQYRRFVVPLDVLPSP